LAQHPPVRLRQWAVLHRQGRHRAEDDGFRRGGIREHAVNIEHPTSNIQHRTSAPFSVRSPPFSVLRPPFSVFRLPSSVLRPPCYVLRFLSPPCPSATLMIGPCATCAFRCRIGATSGARTACRARFSGRRIHSFVTRS